MSAGLPLITVIIAARPELQEPLALSGCRSLDYPSDRLELIIARGAQPSVQRNAAVREARGDWIYFLDDDSVPEAGNLRRALPHLDESDVEAVGGPNVCPADAPPLERVFAEVMGNRLAFGPSAARYRPVGGVRSTGEKELILCNLILRRSAFLDRGGFDESLYPNEENALMDAIQASGRKLLYDPAFVVQRRPRRNVRAFLRMLLNYGRGRAEQFRLHPTFGSALNFVPPAFCVYLAVLPWLPLGLVLPLVVYAALLVVSALPSARTVGWRWVQVACFVAVTHVFYGLGFWRGLFTSLKAPGQRADIPVTVEHRSLA